MGSMGEIRPLKVKRARQLRLAPTRAEAHLWEALRDYRLGGWRWKRQVPFGPFILDLLCRPAALVLEIDGGYHHEDIQRAYDLGRTRYLTARGLRVLRFSNDQVLDRRDLVCAAILEACTLSPEPRASGAQRGRGPGCGRRRGLERQDDDPIMPAVSEVPR
jgi:very-short-patch-repair endonuclease